MQIDSEQSDETVLAELGRRLRRTRLERNLSQVELAEEAGVERKAVQRVEAGESVRSASLVRLLRVLGLIEALDRLVPEPPVSPSTRRATSPMDRPPSRRLVNITLMSCTAPKKMPPSTTHSQTGCHPSASASVGPTRGPAPAMEAKWCPNTTCDRLVT